MDVARDHWAGFFDRLSNDHLGDQVEIEVLGDQIGDQIEVTRQPFEALTYDTRNDTVIVSAADPAIRHMVLHPTWELLEYVCLENDRCAGGNCVESDAQKQP